MDWRGGHTAPWFGGGWDPPSILGRAAFVASLVARLAGFVAGGVVMVVVAKVRTSTRAGENSYRKMEVAVHGPVSYICFGISRGCHD